MTVSTSVRVRLRVVFPTVTEPGAFASVRSSKSARLVSGRPMYCEP